MNLNIDIQSDSSTYNESKGTTENTSINIQPGVEAETSFSTEPIDVTSVGNSSPLVVQPLTPSPLTTPTTSIFGNSQTLAQEFSQVNLDIPNLEMERVRL